MVIGLVDYLFETVSSVVKTAAASLCERTKKLSVKVNVWERGSPYAILHYVLVKVSRIGFRLKRW